MFLRQFDGQILTEHDGRLGQIQFATQPGNERTRDLNCQPNLLIHQKTTRPRLPTSGNGHAAHAAVFSHPCRSEVGCAGSRKGTTWLANDQHRLECGNQVGTSKQCHHIITSGLFQFCWHHHHLHHLPPPHQHHRHHHKCEPFLLGGCGGFKTQGCAQ